MRSRRLMAASFVVALTLGAAACGEVAVEDVEDPLDEESMNEDPAGENSTQGATY